MNDQVRPATPSPSSPSPTASAELTRSLAQLLELGRKARHAQGQAELDFLLVNETTQLVPYRQSVLWLAGSGVEALSGLVQPEANAPYTLWVTQVAKYLTKGAADGDAGDARQPRAFSAANLPQSLAQEWADWWPGQALWLPLPPALTTAEDAPKPAHSSTTQALILLRDDFFSESELALLREWLDAWWHASVAWHRRRRKGWLNRWRRTEIRARQRFSPYLKGDGVTAARARPFWLKPSLWLAAAAVGAAAMPVRLTVLAPGELVPRNPVILRAPMDGVVDVFHVKPNETVKKGQALYGFDEAVIQSKLDVANQAMATAATEYRQTLQQALGDPRVRPQLAVLAGRIQEKRAELSYLKDQLTRSRVLAPQDGVALFDDPSDWIGKPVSVGERIMRIAAMHDVEVEAWLPIGDAIPLGQGDAVELFLNANPLQPVAAQLRYMAHEAQQRPDGTWAYRIRATLDGPTDQRVGLKGTARLEGDTVPAIYWVLRRPIAAVRTQLGL
jgi:HlyD family secretion protein